MDAFAIGRSGLDASMLRLTASASNIANAGAAAYQPIRVESMPLAGGAVQARLVPVDPAYRLTYDPRSRNADGRGMIAAPNVDVTDELVETLSAKLAFEANLKVVSTAADLEKRSIDLLG